MKNIQILFSTLILLALVSCEKEYYNPKIFTRTVIVYLGRDNNLAGSGEEKIKYMLEGWDGQNGHMIIYEDKGGTANLMEVYKENGINTTETIREYENDNSASPEVLNRVINDVITNYPSDSYGLIVFSHASGWLPQGTLNSPRSFIPDQKDEMELADFASAIPNGCFDFIIFEACYTAGIEVAYELKDKADYILGSSTEVVSPGFIEIYPTSMNYLFEEKPRLVEFTRNIYNLFSTSDRYYQSGTFSLIKTEPLTELKSFLQTAIDKEKIPTINISDVQSFDPRSYHLFFDFEDYFSRILKDGSSQKELQALINNCIVYEASTPEFFQNNPSWGGYVIKNHSGLTTYIQQDMFPYLNESYKELSWTKGLFD